MLIFKTIEEEKMRKIYIDAIVIYKLAVSE